MPNARTPHRDDVAHALFRCRRQLWWASHRRLEAAGETMWEWQMLANARHGSLSQSRLAEATAQHPTAVSRLLADLEEQGLVRRMRDEQDRRRMLVELTEAGRAKYVALSGVVWGAMAEHLAVLGADELTELHRLLGKVLGSGDPFPVGSPVRTPARRAGSRRRT